MHFCARACSLFYKLVNTFFDVLFIVCVREMSSKVCSASLADVFFQSPTGGS